MWSISDGVECCALRVLVSGNSAVSENVDFEVPRTDGQTDDKKLNYILKKWINNKPSRYGTINK